MSREDERAAFARASAFLNYQPLAKWTAYISAALTALLYVTLLMLLTLTVDVIVHRGQLPELNELTASARLALTDRWDKRTPDEQAELLSQIAPSSELMTHEDGKTPFPNPAIVNPDEELIWKAERRQIIADRVGVSAAESSQNPDYSHGILSLVVRSHANERLHAPLVSWFASWNPWSWRSSSSAVLFSPYLFGLFILGLVCLIARTGFTLLMHEMAARCSIEASSRLRRAAYHHTFRLGTLAFRALGPSEAVTVFSRHVEAVHDALYLRLTSQFRDPVTFGMLLLFALLVSPGLALAFLLFALLVWVVGGQIAANFRKQGRRASNEASERLTLIRESLMMMRLVKVYMMELFNQSRVERQLARLARAQQVRYRGEAFYRPLLLLLGSVACLLLLYVASVIVLRGWISLASVIAMTVALISLYWPLQGWLNDRKLIRRGREASVQLFHFLDRRSDVGQAVGAEFLPSVEKYVEFDNVSLREPGSGRMLLQNISLTIKAGHRIGLVGSDNLEKHALVYLIPRLLDPTTGEIRIDEHNLRWVTLDSLRDKIAMVMMNDLVFHDTVANNIGCGDSSYSLPRIIDAAKMSRAHQFIQKMPKGYETVVGELGQGLTTSQKYRIALARAILRDPALIILEEPEEQFDEETKDLIDDSLARFLPGRTVIFLPHRVSTIKSCDRILLLHNGKLEAAGVHKELLTQNKLYRHLHYLEFSEMAEVVG